MTPVLAPGRVMRVPLMVACGIAVATEAPGTTLPILAALGRLTAVAPTGFVPLTVLVATMPIAFLATFAGTPAGFIVATTGAPTAFLATPAPALSRGASRTAGVSWAPAVKYFDSIPHSQLRDILDRRVTDGVIRRMIDKWLNAGDLEDGLLRNATAGS